MWSGTRDGCTHIASAPKICIRISKHQHRIITRNWVAHTYETARKSIFFSSSVISVGKLSCPPPHQTMPTVVSCLEIPFQLLLKRLSLSRRKKHNFDGKNHFLQSKLMFCHQPLCDLIQCIYTRTPLEYLLCIDLFPEPVSSPWLCPTMFGLLSSDLHTGVWLKGVTRFQACDFLSVLTSHHQKWVNLRLVVVFLT